MWKGSGKNTLHRLLLKLTRLACVIGKDPAAIGVGIDLPQLTECSIRYTLARQDWGLKMKSDIPEEETWFR